LPFSGTVLVMVVFLMYHLIYSYLCYVISITIALQKYFSFFLGWSFFIEGVTENDWTFIKKGLVLGSCDQWWIAVPIMWTSWNWNVRLCIIMLRTWYSEDKTLELHPVCTGLVPG
jgi:hypothetical protein